MTFSIKTGDLEPPLIVDVSGVTGDLNDVTSWRLVARFRGADDILFEDTSPDVDIDPTDPTKAVVTHEFVQGETDVAGVVQVEVKAMWPDNRPQTIPQAGYSQFRIGDDLDPVA